MTGATKRPWYATGIHVQSAAINEDNYVCTAEGDTPEAAIENADLIVKAVNSHDALIAALERLVDTVDVRASEFSTHSIQFQMSVTKAREALEAAKCH